MVIDHIRKVVLRREDEIQQWKSLFGYPQVTERVTNTRQKGGGMQYICFKYDNIDTAVKQFRGLGLRVLSEPQPGETFDNRRISYVYAKQGLNIELIDTEKKARLIGTFSKEKPSP